MSRGLLRARTKLGALCMLLPAIGFLGVFFVYPTFELISRTFTEGSPGGIGANMSWLFGSGVNVTVLIRTFVTAAIVTAVCIAVGYPFAYALTRVGRRTCFVLLGIVIASLFTSFMVRNYAWYVVLQDSGPLNKLLALVGLGPLDLLGTTTAVVIGMAQILLPLMILPLYASMRGVDWRLMQAAQSLGASARQAFARVYLPLSAPGLLVGSLLVFVISLGFFVTPTLLGSPTNALASQLIVTQVSRLLEWGRAGAIAVVLLVGTLAVLGVLAFAAKRLVRITTLEGAASDGGGSGMPDPGRLAWPLYLVVGAVVVWLVAPLLVIVPASFSGIPSLTFPPPSYSIQWYENFFSNPLWYGALARSLQVGGLVVLFSLTLGAPAAWFLSRRPSRLRLPALGLVLAPAIVPLIVVAVGVYAVFLEWGLTGTLVGVVAAHVVLALPFVVVILMGSFSTFDQRLLWAASSLGATPIQAFRRVAVPLLMPGILTAALVAFVTSFDEIVVAFFVVSPSGHTLPVEMFSSVTRQIDPTMAAAAVMLLVVTLVGLTAAYLVDRMHKRRLTEARGV